MDFQAYRGGSFDVTARRGPGELLPVVEVEIIGHGTCPGLPDRLHRFLEILVERLGVKPMIYTAPSGRGKRRYPG